MKTNLRPFGIAAAALGLFATLTFAGPGPQYWNRPATKLPETKSPAAAAKCPGCSTTVKWVTGDRGPAGKGIPGTSVAGKTHTCSFCTGTVTTEKGRTSHAMTHASPCAQLRCCTTGT